MRPFGKRIASASHKLLGRLMRNLIEKEDEWLSGDEKLCRRIDTSLG